MKKIETKDWHSPKQCGCIVQMTTAWGKDYEDIATEVDNKVDSSKFKDKDSADKYKQKLRDDLVIKYQNEMVTVSPTAIVSQCIEHEDLDTPELLHAELKQWTSQAYRPDTCGCSVATYSHRDTPDIQIPYDCHKHTVKCEHHADLSCEDHCEAIKTENVNKNIIVNQIAEDLAIPAEDVKYSFGELRGLKIHCELKDKTIIEEAIAKVVPNAEVLTD